MYATPENRRCKFVSFSGIDGAGKSTQIETLRTWLQEADHTVRLIAFWDDVARFTRLREQAGHTLFQGDTGVGTPAAPIHRRDKNVRSRLMTVLRLFLYFADAISLRVVLQKALRSGADFVICDRYIYDELANLTLANPVARVYARLIAKLVPRPNISYLLDADPIQARARKPEYPLDFLHANRASYLALSDLLGGMTIIAPMSIQNVEREVQKHALKELSFAFIQKENDESIAG
jgi:thymidylate kinase